MSFNLNISLKLFFLVQLIFLKSIKPISLSSVSIFAVSKFISIIFANFQFKLLSIFKSLYFSTHSLEFVFDKTPLQPCLLSYFSNPMRRALSASI